MAGPTWRTTSRWIGSTTRATDGNIALTGEIDLSRGHEFTLGLAFGRSMHSASGDTFPVAVHSL